MDNKVPNRKTKSQRRAARKRAKDKALINLVDAIWNAELQENIKIEMALQEAEKQIDISCGFIENAG